MAHDNAAARAVAYEVYLDKAATLLKQAEGGLSYFSSRSDRAELELKLAEGYTELAKVAHRVKRYEDWRTDS